MIKFTNTIGTKLIVVTQWLECFFLWEVNQGIYLMINWVTPRIKIK